MKVLINAGVSIRSKNNPIKLGAPFWPLANCLSESDTIIYIYGRTRGSIIFLITLKI